jgi:hypothetical protein
MRCTRLAVRLATVAALSVPAAVRAQMPRAEPIAMPRGTPDGTDLCPASPPAASAPVQRIKVIVPPPEIVYREAPAKHGLLNCLGKPAPAPCAAPAPAGGGTVSFNMNMSVPFMMNAAGSLPGGNLLAGLNGLGGANNSALATALGLSGTGGAGNGMSPQDALLLRALLNRSAPGATDGLTGNTPPSADDVEARIRKLNDAITAAMNAEMDRVRRDLKQDLTEAMTRLLKASKDVESLQMRVKALEDKKPNP